MQQLVDHSRRALGAARKFVDLRQGRLAPRLVALFLLAAVVPLLAAVLIGGRATNSVLQDQAQANLQSYASSVALRDAAQSAVTRFLGSDPSYTIGFLLSEKGIVQFSTDPALYAKPDLS